MTDYGALLTSQGILYTAGPSQLVPHRWDSGWVPAAVAALYQDSLSLPPGPNPQEDHLAGHPPARRG